MALLDSSESLLLIFMNISCRTNFHISLFYAFSFWDFHTAVISQKIQDTAKECKGETRREGGGGEANPKGQRKLLLLCSKFIKLPLGQIGGAAWRWAWSPDSWVSLHSGRAGEGGNPGTAGQTAKWRILKRTPYSASPSPSPSSSHVAHENFPC